MGDGRLDFGPKIPYTIQPYANLQPNVDEAYRFPTNPHPTKKPIVVLADVNSVSCAEMTTMGIASLPNGYFVGERTWGGQGMLLGNNRASVWLNAGEFSTPFVTTVYTPFQQFTYQDGRVYEGIGFPPKPELEVKYNAAALAQGIDPQLEKALQVILSAN
jgi:C-terminal processing protease CtpA/Prc